MVEITGEIFVTWPRHAVHDTDAIFTVTVDFVSTFINHTICGCFENNHGIGE